MFPSPIDFFPIFQEIVKTPSGYVSMLAWMIISAEATAIAGMACYIRILFNKIQAIQEKRVKVLEDQLALVRTARDEARTS